MHLNELQIQEIRKKSLWEPGEVCFDKKGLFSWNDRGVGLLFLRRNGAVVYS